MPPTTRKKASSAFASSSFWSWSSSLSSHLHTLLFSPTRVPLITVSLLLLLAEVAINVLAIERVRFTEIDWVAYMQEVAPVIHNATYNYSVLRGDTGPLVYPAGFVWIFSGLFFATDEGANVRRAQYIFAVIYLVHMALVFRIMVKTEKVPPYALIIMSLTAYRIHSIFVLRLFNDPIAMLLLYAAVNCFISDFWTLGSVMFSLAVSVKMNILLFAPALFFAYLATQGLLGTIWNLSVCAAIQVILAWPFLMHDPVAYMKGAFDIGRVFLFEWTVNWRFLPEEVFVNKTFHLTLLFVHVLVLLLCIPKWWKMLTNYDKLRRNDGPTWSVQLLVLPLFMSNFVGMVFARSLHYQFYVWYYHQLHYLLWCTKLPVVGKLLILGVIELCWNTYPSTYWSSGLLHFSHIVMLVALVLYIYGISMRVEEKKVAKKKQK